MEKVLSVKIVTVDYYSSFPIPELDVTTSESRKNANVKMVNKLRIKMSFLNNLVGLGYSFAGIWNNTR